MTAISAALSGSNRTPPRPSAPGGWARLPLVLVALTALAACSHGRELRVEDLPATAPQDPEYKINPGDVIGVRVWNQEPMSLPRARVREDGRISLPFLQDVDVAGVTPAELSQRLQTKLKTFVVNPVVTVTLEELRPVRVSVLGEVTRPGVYDLDRGSGVLAALAAGGGLTEFAHRDRIYVLRYHHWADGDPTPARIRFGWTALARGDRAAATFELRTGDLVVVE